MTSFLKIIYSLVTRPPWTVPSPYSSTCITCMLSNITLWYFKGRAHLLWSCALRWWRKWLL